MGVNSKLHTVATLSPGKEVSSTYSVGGWMDSRATLDNLEKS